MTVIDGDILKIAYEVLLETGTIAQNVYYLRADFVASQADLTVQNSIETWIEAMYSELSSQLPNTMTQRLCSIDEIVWNVGDQYWETVRNVGLFTPTIGFNNATEPLPNQCAAVATFNTFLPRSRSRKFLFPFGEDQQDASILIGAALTALAEYADAALDDIVIGPLNELGTGVVRTAANVFLTFANAVVTDLIRTQRRRVQGVGI